MPLQNGVTVWRLALLLVTSCSVESEVGLVKSVLLGIHVGLVLHVQSVHWEGSGAVELSYEWGELRLTGGQSRNSRYM